MCAEDMFVIIFDVLNSRTSFPQPADSSRFRRMVQALSVA
jgi:hypothetical protein